MSETRPIQTSARVTGPLTAVAGQTVFQGGYPIDKSDDVFVTRQRGTEVSVLSLSADYTVTGMGGTAFTVTLTAGAEAGDSLLLIGKAAIERVISVTSAGRYSSALIEAAFDRLHMIAQELRRDVDDVANSAIGPYDARGGSAGRAAYDAEAEGFTYLDLDVEPMAYFVRRGDAGGWRGPIYTGFQRVGEAGLDLLAAETLTGVAQLLVAEPAFEQIAVNKADIAAHLARLAAAEGNITSLQGASTVVKWYLDYTGGGGLSADASATGTGGQVVREAGSHVDPVSGLTVPNIGSYVKVAGGWTWVSYSRLDTDTGEVYADETTRGLPLLSDRSGNNLVTIDPSVFAPVVLHGDVNIGPGLDGVHALGQSHAAGGSGQDVSKNPGNTLPRWPNLDLMFAKLGTIGVAGQDISQWDLRKVVPLAEGLTADLWDQPPTSVGKADNESMLSGLLSQIRQYEAARKITMKRILAFNISQGSANYGVLRGSENGTGPESQNFKSCRAALLAAKDFDPSYKMRFVLFDWNGGDAANLSLTKAAFKDLVLKLYADYQRLYIETGTRGTKGDILFACNQFATFNGVGGFAPGHGIQDAILELAAEFEAAPLAITAISKSNPVVVTFSGTPPANGEWRWIDLKVRGMWQMRGQGGVVQNATATTFELAGIDSTGFSTYESGGNVMRPRFILAAPHYSALHGDEGHHTAHGYMMIGAEAGDSIVRYEYGEASPAVKMTGGSIAGNVITITTSALSALEFATCPTAITPPANKGFVVTNAGDVAQTISGVALNGTNIEITMAAAPSAGFKVKAGRIVHNVNAWGPGAVIEVRATSTDLVNVGSGETCNHWLHAGEITL